MTKARYIFIVLLIWVIPFTLQASNLISIVSMSVEAGSEFTVEIEIDNSDPFVGFQAEVIIPSEFAYIDGSAAINPLRSLGHTISANVVGNTLRILSWSGNNTSFTGTSGTLVSFKLKAGTLPGNYALALTNTQMSNATSQPLTHTRQNGTITIQGPNLQASHDILEIGRVALTASDTRYLTLNNIGNQNLEVSEITFTNPQFTSPIVGGIILSAGESLQIPVEFAPTIKGTYNEQMKILSNDPDTPEALISLKAIGFAVNEIHLIPVSGRSGFTVTLPIHINNMEPFTGFQIELALPEQVKYLDKSIRLASRTTDHTIVADTLNKKLVITSYSPSNSAFTGVDGMIASLDLYIEGMGGTYPIYFVNALISDVSATNILSDYYNSYVSIISPQISITGEMLNFGRISVFDEKRLTYNVWNYGSDSLEVLSVIPSNEAFTPDINSTRQLIAPGQYREYGVTFKSSTKGEYNGNLILRSNDKTNDPVYVYLSGETFEPNELVIRNALGSAGSSITLEVELNNYSNITALQFDLSLPDGFSANLDSCVLTDRATNHVISANKVNDQIFRFLVYSMNMSTFMGNSGVVLQIPVEVASTVADGSYSISVSDVSISNDVNENVFSGQNNGLITITPFIQPNVVFPADDEIELNWGKSFQIGWEDFAGSSVKIELVKGTEVIGTIVSSTPNDGLYVWTISSDFQPGMDYKIKVTSLENSAISEISDSFFTILNQMVTLEVDSEPISASLNYPMEFNWYRFQTGEAGQYTIQTFGTTDTFLELYKEDGLFLIESRNDTLNDINAKIVRNLEANTWYRIKVRGNLESTTGNYSIGVSLKITNANEISHKELSLINYPNPFEGSTTFIYYLPVDDEVVISVIDIFGRTIATIFSGHQSAGLNKVSWEATCNNGLRIPSGIYFGQLITGNQKRVIRLIHK